MRQTISAAIAAAAITGPPKPTSGQEMLSSTRVSPTPMAQTDVTRLRQPIRTRSGRDAATMTAPNMTPPVVTCWLTASGASIAADMPKRASGSCFTRSATATAVPAITAASGADAPGLTRW